MDFNARAVVISLSLIGVLITECFISLLYCMVRYLQRFACDGDDALRRPLSTKRSPLLVMILCDDRYFGASRLHIAFSLHTLCWLLPTISSIACIWFKALLHSSLGLYRWVPAWIIPIPPRHSLLLGLFLLCRMLSQFPFDKPILPRRLAASISQFRFLSFAFFDYLAARRFDDKLASRLPRF